MWSERSRQAQKNRMYPDGLNSAEENFEASLPHGKYISIDSCVRKYQLQTIIHETLFNSSSLLQN
jgi:hypothetical protein